MKPVRFLATLLTASALLLAGGAARATELRVGYWTSGISLGFGSVLEAQKCFEKRGLQVKFIHFPDVNGPTTALASNAIDLAFGASLAGAYSLAQQGVPVKMVAATQIVDAEFVTLADSPIHTLADLRGKMVGMSPLGSATTGVGTSVLEGNYGLKSGDYRLASGDEPRLAQFLVQKNVDAAMLRPSTVAQVPDSQHKLRVIATLADQWKQMTHTGTPPYIGVAMMRSEWLNAHPADASKVIEAMQDALAIGRTHPDLVVASLKQMANLGDSGARFYADHWMSMNTVSFGPDDISTLKRTFDVFKSAGALKGSLPADVFDLKPWQDAQAAK